MASELSLRWLTAALLVPPVLFACYLGGPLYVGLISAFAAIGVHEFQGFLRAKGIPVQPALGVAGGMLLPWATHFGGAAGALAALGAVGGGAFAQQLAAGRAEGTLATVSGTLLGVAYVGGGLAYGVALRDFAHAPAGLLHPGAGFFFAVFAQAATIGSDAGGYFTGRRFGRRKLAPRVSPGKTVEGGLGAIAMGAVFGVAALAIFRAAAPDLTAGFSWAAAVGAGSLLAATAIAGDLVESLLKRDSGLKDAGHILPGIGGVLDRIDSALLGFPVMYAWLLGYYAAGS